MITFFEGPAQEIYAVKTAQALSNEDIQKFTWLFDEAQKLDEESITGAYVGPRSEMISPWSTNAVEIAQNMGLSDVQRIERFDTFIPGQAFDPMLQAHYEVLDQEMFTLDKTPEPVLPIEDIAAYNEEAGLALSEEEIEYLEKVSADLGRPLTDSEVFGFSQVNSEHCRHKIFNGQFIIDGKEKPSSLFRLIRKTSEAHPNKIVSAYKDNVAFIGGPEALQFSPEKPDVPSEYQVKQIKSVLSLKAETHNFPTTVEPFYGASTGSGGEIRDRMAGGKASIPLAGTAVYMTSYPRLKDNRPWEQHLEERPWLYQTPKDILIKASNGASDFGNKFGQPLIAGSLTTFEHQEHGKSYGFDKVIMLAGGIGYAKEADSQKAKPQKGDQIVVLGGDNYRIGMGGSAVSSVATGQFGQQVELNAVQRANPEMQKRVANAIRAMAELSENPILAIHDHGAGGHLNCLSELVEDTGGLIHLRKLPVGDPTLSAKEIIGNESQERMGLVIRKEDLPLLERVAERERAPLYVVGEITDDHMFRIVDDKEGEQNPVDWKLSHMFGNSPKTILEDKKQSLNWKAIDYDPKQWKQYLEEVLQLEAVAAKDWLTNKVDRCVTGRVALQQTTGELQLPLNNLGIMAIDYNSHKGIATSIGHAPVSALVDPKAGSTLSIIESLTNLVWAPLTHGFEGISLSANWMWPAKNEGENARLYEAVEAASETAIALGINIPTGKDSLSMTQKYPDGKTVYAPGTVIISTVAEVEDIRKTVTPGLKNVPDSEILLIDCTSTDTKALGGSSFAQTRNALDAQTPQVKDLAYFKTIFETVQGLIKKGQVYAGHDIASGGLITTLLEMCFPNTKSGMHLSLEFWKQEDWVPFLFSENPGLVLQVGPEGKKELEAAGIQYQVLGTPTEDRILHIKQGQQEEQLEIPALRKTWFETSYLLDKEQSGADHAKTRFDQLGQQPLQFEFPKSFSGDLKQLGIQLDRQGKTGLKAAIIREKGVNSEREMAYMLHIAGFDVKDVHMTDLVSGRETLEDVHFIVFTGGFSNSDVLGSAKGWAGAFKYNDKAKEALDKFYARPDTLSLGVCNGCQLMVALDLLYPEHEEKIKMHHNDSGKFECGFVNVNIPENNAVMLQNMAGARLGIWVAHGEGRFDLPLAEDQYHIAAQYSYGEYPAQPNGSDFNIAALCSADGRHLAMMPHLERSIFPWNWPHYPEDRKADAISPWIMAMQNAAQWLKKQINA